MSNTPKHEPGDVFQITEAHGQIGWVGCFVMATEVRDTGITGFVGCPAPDGPPGRASIRLDWVEIDFIGTATHILENMIPDQQ